MKILQMKLQETPRLLSLCCHTRQPICRVIYLCYPMTRSWPSLYRFEAQQPPLVESPLARSMHLLIDVDVLIDVWDRLIVTSVVHLQKHISISRGQVCSMIASATKQSKVTCWQCVRRAEGIEVVSLHVVSCWWRGCKE